MFPKVKNVNVESPKKHSKLLVFSARSFLFPLQEPHEWFHQSGFHFVWEYELFPGTRIEHELFMNCSEINETINGH